MTIDNFEKLVKRGIDDIPQKFLDKINNVGIVIEEEPTQAQLKKMKIGRNYLLFGLYEGVPKTKRWEYGQVLPDKITIFKNPIEEYAQSEKEVADMVRDTVWHEIAHHFGMDEKMVRNAESRKKKD